MSSDSSKLMYDYSDPKRVGRGIWFMFMMLAMKSENQGERDYLCKAIRKCCDNFKCSKCQGHFYAYLDAHPPEKESSTNDSLFRWVVTFMSAVNVRIGKPSYDYGKLYDIFGNPMMGVCQADCGSDEAQPSEGPRRPAKIPVEEAVDAIPGLFVRSDAPKFSSRPPPRRRR